MNIRSANIKDSEAISALAHSLSEKYIAHEFSDEGRQRLLNAMTPAAIARHIEAGCRYHVAEENGRVIGVVGIKDNKHLYHLFVAETHQHRGIARKLWYTAMAACLADGNQGEFTVNASTYAKPLYEKLGFVAQTDAQTRGGVTSIPMKLRVGS